MSELLRRTLQLRGLVKETNVNARTTPAKGLLPAGDAAVSVVAKFFRALGDPTRLKLLEFLLDEEHTVTECVGYAGLAQSRVSTHLACLADCGYLSSRREGRNIFYRLSDPRVATLVRIAHELAADNHEALCACHRIADPPGDEALSGLAQIP
jgi:DNA-binding transcriptional ArsR family regulator